jgi:hypothetical protein
MNYYATEEIRKYYEVTRRKLSDAECEGLGQPERVIPELYRVFAHFVNRIEALEEQVRDLKAKQPVEVSAEKRGFFR